MCAHATEMGNCMESLAPKQELQRKEEHNQVYMDSEERCAIRVRMLVTRKELEVLVKEQKKGERRLEEILVEMGEERERREKKLHGLQIGWKPELEKIEESREAAES